MGIPGQGARARRELGSSQGGPPWMDTNSLLRTKEPTSRHERGKGFMLLAPWQRRWRRRQSLDCLRRSRRRFVSLPGLTKKFCNMFSPVNLARSAAAMVDCTQSIVEFPVIHRVAQKRPLESSSAAVSRLLHSSLTLAPSLA